MARIFQTPHELKAAVGEQLGSSDWLEISQERIDLFADATGDHQWIHVDPEKAASGPFGATIAHGYLTLSLVGGLYLANLRWCSARSMKCLVSDFLHQVLVKI